MGHKSVDYQRRTGVYQSSPLHRFLVTDQIIVHFHAFYWGLIHSGNCMAIKEAADMYLKRFSPLDIDINTLEQGYYRLNRVFQDVGKKNIR